MRKMKGKIGKVLVALLLVASLVSSIATIDAADDYKPQDANTEMGVYFNVTYAEIGDTFNATIYLNPGGETVTTWKIQNLTFNEDTLGMVNATGCIIKGQWRTGFQDDGSIHNDTGNISSTPTGFQSFMLAGTGNNYTAAEVNFTALQPGTLSLKFSNHQDWDYGVRIDDAGGSVVNHTVNATLVIYPQDPASFSVTTYNHTAINLSWTFGQGDDNVTLCGKTGSYPANPGDSVLYNGTNLSYNHTGLDNCTTYFYRVWGWNETANMHSLDYRSGTGTTLCYSNITLSSAVPTNNTAIANCTYSQTVNVTVENSRGRTCLYWINGSNGQSTSGSVLNNSISLAMTTLSHNTTYWWNVTASEQGIYGSGDSSQAQYLFTTGQGGGTAPVGSNAYPNGVTSLAISPISFAAKPTDADGDPTNVSFFWGNGTFIGYHNMTYSGNTATSIFSTYPLAYNTTYTWYTLLNDTSGCGTSTRYPTAGSFFSFTTDEQIATLTKEWMVHSNNTVQMWVNTTNVGETDLTNGYINETWDYDYLTLVGATMTADGTDSGRYNITWMNQTNSTELVMFFSIKAPIPNGTVLSDTAKVIFNGTTLNTFTPTDLPTMSFYATKDSNESVLYWYTSDVNFTINITNTGDFYMNWTQVNETYSPNLTYWDSSITPNATNETFNITQIAPGATSSLWIRMNVTAAELVNGTDVYNNITIRCNESSSEVTATTSMPVGAITSMLRITYDAQLTEVVGFGTTIMAILGVLLIIGAIFLIVMVVNRGGLFGPGE